jgi:DAK2 domain
MPQNRVDLASIFNAVTQTLAQNQQVLNQADEVNHDHGNNMVQTFQTITNSLEAKQGKPASTALSYAAKKVTKTTTSSSGQLYAQGLAQAADKLKGKKVDAAGAMDLLQTLISGGQSSQQAQQSSGGDMLGTLLGQLTGGAQPQSQQTSQPGGDMLSTLLGQVAGGTTTQEPQAPHSAGGDMLSTLLGGLTGGGGTSTGSGSGLDLGDLLNAGMSYMQAKQSGGSTAQALVQAFMAASGMGNATHRQESTSLVVNSFLQALAKSSKPR